MAQRALILFAHGARAASWAAPFEKLRDLTQARMPDAEVTLAFLELMEPNLPDAVLAQVTHGAKEITIVPVFLGQGGHVLRDLPVLVDQLRFAHPEIVLNVVRAVGEDPSVLEALATYCVNSVG
jgi:sirohydrochlorin cobaltochelatase